jgi:hypothetical protein
MRRHDDVPPDVLADVGHQRLAVDRLVPREDLLRGHGGAGERRAVLLGIVAGGLPAGITIDLLAEGFGHAALAELVLRGDLGDRCAPLQGVLDLRDPVRLAVQAQRCRGGAEDPGP